MFVSGTFLSTMRDLSGRVCLHGAGILDVVHY